MIRGLIILTSSDIGCRDLWWPDDPLAITGYNVYRALDYPTNWKKLNTNPVPGHSFRDQTQLTQVVMPVTSVDWVTQGELGNYGIKLKDVPYRQVVQGRPEVASAPDDVQVTINGTPVRPTQVTGLDRTVWLNMDRTLPTGGAVSDFSLPVPGSNDTVVATYFKLSNYVDIYTTMTRTFYTVVPLDIDRNEIHDPGAPGTEIRNTMEIERLDYMQERMITLNTFLFEFNGEPCWLMLRRTKGDICGCKEGNGVYQARAGCPDCYGIGIVGGYYGPIDFTYIDPDTSVTREIDEGGQKVTRTTRSYVGPVPIIQDGDLIIRKNGERLVIHGVNSVSQRGVLLQQEYDTTLLNHGDTRYLIPVVPNTSMLFNPLFQEDPGLGEPVAQHVNIPGEKQWENPDTQVGRTVTFGNIQS